MISAEVVRRAVFDRSEAGYRFDVWKVGERFLPSRSAFGKAELLSCHRIGTRPDMYEYDENL